MWTCKHCKKEFELLTPSEKANHSRWCIENPKRKDYEYNNVALDAMKNARIEKGYTNQFTKARITGEKIPHNTNKGKHIKGHPHTEEYKLLMSKRKKEWLKNNPDKHPWKNHKKFKSIPCEKFKQMLKDNTILFVEEYQPLFPERFFSVDIAFPDKKLAIEINGNQHYNSDKTLKPYYQKRHDLLEQNGWKVYEYHYSISYDENKMKEIVQTLKTENSLSNVDYSFYIIENTPKESHNLCSCGNEKCIESKYCLDCHNSNKLGIARPNTHYCSSRTKSPTHDYCICGNKKLIKSSFCSKCSNKVKIGKYRKFFITKTELEQLLMENSLCEIGKIYGVSDNAIRKRCKEYGLIIPKHEPGYWAKKYAGKI